MQENQDLFGSLLDDVMNVVEILVEYGIMNIIQ